MKRTLDLRKGVDFIGVNCVFFCHDGKGNLLMQKRSKKCRDEQGVWDCGGGSMEFGESFEDTAIREIKEEYGVKPTKLRFCYVKNVLRKNGHKKTHWVAVVFSAQVNPKQCVLGDSEKIDEIAWFSINKLPKLLHSEVKKDLAQIKKAGGL